MKKLRISLLIIIGLLIGCFLTFQGIDDFRNNDLVLELNKNVYSTSLIKNQQENNDPSLIFTSNQAIANYSIGGDGLSPKTAYQIHSLNIDVLETNFAIKLFNISVYVKIEKIDINILNYSQDVTCVLVENCSNIYFEDIQIDNPSNANAIGIEIRDSKNIKIINSDYSWFNNIENLRYGLILQNSQNCIIEYLNFHFIALYAVEIWECSNISVSNCSYNNVETTLQGSTGVFVHKSEKITISKNEFTGGISGVTIDYSAHILIKNNFISDSDISFFDCNLSDVIDNEFESSGLYLYGEYIDILDNSFYDLNYDNIEIDRSLHIKFQRNRFSNFQTYVFRFMNGNHSIDENITIVHNTFSRIGYGLIYPSGFEKYNIIIGWNWYLPSFNSILLTIALVMIVLFYLKASYETEEFLKKDFLKNLPEGMDRKAFSTAIRNLQQEEKYRFSKRSGQLLIFFALVLPFSIVYLVHPGSELYSLFQFLTTGYNDRILTRNLANIIFPIIWIGIVAISYRLLNYHKKSYQISPQKLNFSELISKIPLWVRFSLVLGIFIIYLSTFLLSNLRYYSSGLFILGTVCILIGVINSLIHRNWKWGWEWFVLGICLWIISIIIISSLKSINGWSSNLYLDLFQGLIFGAFLFTGLLKILLSFNQLGSYSLGMKKQ